MAGRRLRTLNENDDRTPYQEGVSAASDDSAIYFIDPDTFENFSDFRRSMRAMERDIADRLDDDDYDRGDYVSDNLIKTMYNAIEDQPFAIIKLNDDNEIGIVNSLPDGLDDSKEIMRGLMQDPRVQDITYSNSQGQEVTVDLDDIDIDVLARFIGFHEGSHLEQTMFDDSGKAIPTINQEIEADLRAYIDLLENGEEDMARIIHEARRQGSANLNLGTVDTHNTSAAIDIEQVIADYKAGLISSDSPYPPEPEEVDVEAPIIQVGPQPQAETQPLNENFTDWDTAAVSPSYEAALARPNPEPSPAPAPKVAPASAPPISTLD